MSERSSPNNMSSNNKEKSGKRAQSGILAGMSHDLKNPLHGILSYANFGIKKTQSEELTKDKTIHYFERIKDAGLRLQNLLDDLLDLAKLDSGSIKTDIQERNLSAITQSVVLELERKRPDSEATYDLDIPESPVMAAVDINLVSKALRFVFIGLSDYAQTKVDFAIKVYKASTACINIRCDLIQLENDQLEILQGFLNNMDHTDPALKSLGIKIAICEKIVEYHKGGVELNRGKGGGFEMVISLA